MGESIWKKEISFGRKPKEPKAEAPAATEAPVEVEPAKSESVPFWKKEISLSRGAKEPKQPKQPKQPKAKKEPNPKRQQEKAAASGDSVPFWKKEVTLSRKRPEPEQQSAEAAPEIDVEPAAPPADDDLDLGAVAERIAPWVAAAAQAAARDDAPTLDMPAPDASAAPAAEAAPEPAPPAVAEPAPEPQPEPIAAPAPDTWVADATLPPEPIAEPSVPAATPRVEVNPPVPAAELPPLEEGEAKVPFWKRDIGRKKAPKAEKEPKQPKRAKAKKAKKAKAAEQPAPEAKGTKLEKAKRAGGGSILKRGGGVKERGGGKVPKKLVGLKIGGSQLAAARVQNNGVAELVQVARGPLDPGVVVGGELRDVEALSEALKDFFKEHKLPKRGVRLGIANNRIGVRTFEIAGIDDPKQLANAIRFRAQEALPIPIEEAVLDYHILAEKQDEEGQNVRRVLLVVAYRDLVDRYVEACKKAGVQLVGIDLEAFALLRALAAPQDGAGGDATAALVAVSIGHDRSTFAVSDGRTCEFTRVLEWGGAMLNVAIARELNAAPSEVEDLKRGLSLRDDRAPEGVTAEQATVAREAVRKQVQTFARELVSSLQFYQSQPGSLGIGEIVLTGGTAHLDGLAEELQRLIGVRVRVGDPLGRLKVPKKFEEPEQLGSLSIAIGLGIDD